MEDIRINNAELIWHNFAGRKELYYRAGYKNFTLILEPSMYEKLKSQGYNIHKSSFTGDSEDEIPYLNVAVSNTESPEIFIITPDYKYSINVDKSFILDRICLKKMNCVIHPFQWTIRDRTGIKPYLKEIEVFIDDPVDIAMVEECILLEMHIFDQLCLDAIKERISLEEFGGDE
jgi:hypothetical protein